MKVRNGCYTNNRFDLCFFFQIKDQPDLPRVIFELRFENGGFEAVAKTENRWTDIASRSISELIYTYS